MKLLGIAKCCWLVLLLGGLMTTGYYLLSTSKYVKMGQQKLREVVHHSYSHTADSCHSVQNRSDDEALRCFEKLAQEVVKMKHHPAQKSKRRKTQRTDMSARKRHLASQQIARAWIMRSYSNRINQRREATKSGGMGRKNDLGFGNQIEMQRAPYPLGWDPGDYTGRNASQQLLRRQQNYNSDREASRIPLGKGSPGAWDPFLSLSGLSPQNKELRQSMHIPLSPRLRQQADYARRFHAANVTANLSAEAAQKIGDRFKQRQVTLQKACQQYRNASLFKPIKGCMFVLPAPPQTIDLGVNYCPIQKTGSTTWKKLLSAIGKDRLQKRPKTKTLNSHPLKDFAVRRTCPNTRTRQERDISFVFVREPYSRLLSAYVDKLFSPNTFFWSRTGKYIVKRFRKNPSKLSLDCGHDVTFAEFIQYVIHAQDTGLHRDGHFVPVHDHCNLCNISYDYIGHLETLDEDMGYLLHVLKSPLSYTGPFEVDTLSNNANWVFNKMRSEIADCISLEQAGKRLWKKWQVRGLISKTEPFPFSAQQTLRLQREEMVEAGLAAIEHSGGLSQRKGQKTEALREAFASVSLSDRLRLKELLFLDFEMFGFDPDLPAVFLKDQPASDTEFSYFTV